MVAEVIDSCCEKVLTTLFRMSDPVQRLQRGSGSVQCGTREQLGVLHDTDRHTHTSTMCLQGQCGVNSAVAC